MSQSRFTLFLVTLVALLALPAAASAAVPEPLQWSLSPKSPGQPKATVPYTLANDTGGVVGYGWRPLGVNLKWNGGGQWKFMKPNPRDHRTITPSEQVALYNTTARKYLNYGHQTWGINLVWSSTPKYEWRVREAAITTPGPTQGRVRVSLYNTRILHYLVYQRRSVGINLGWRADIVFPAARVHSQATGSLPVARLDAAP